MFHSGSSYGHILKSHPINQGNAASFSQIVQIRGTPKTAFFYIFTMNKAAKKINIGL